MKITQNFKIILCPCSAKLIKTTFCEVIIDGLSILPLYSLACMYLFLEFQFTR